MTLVAILTSSGCVQAPRTSEPSAHTIDVAGTWFVLIHYRDPETANPDATRWKDLVWSFARRGSRMEWTEYPGVKLEDDTGRFEAIAGNPRSRTLTGWKPTPEQLEQINHGPRVNLDVARIKTLSGSDLGGWRSSSRRNQSSATVLGYYETLSIENLGSRPLFERADSVGNSTTRNDGGATRYQVNEILNDGRRLVGRYSRDGRLEGRFEMWRTPPARGLETAEENSN